MTLVLARLRQAGRWSWAVFAGGAVFMAIAVLVLLRRYRQADPLADWVARTWRQVDHANARAAVDIAIARTKDQALREEVAYVLEDPDEERRVERLIAVAKKVRGR